MINLKLYPNIYTIMSREIHEYVVNIKSFQMYLDNILVSIDDDRYHEPSIKKLSDNITQYYSMVNGYVDDDIEEIIDDSDTSTTPIKGDKSDSNQASDSSDSDSSDSDSSDSDSSSNDSDIDSLFLSSKKVKTTVEDKYLNEFINETVDNSNIKLYIRKPEYQYNLDNFLTTSQNY
jgi:cobalamin biosynthesis protein CobT